ncbi:SpaH/EbpB family LPXTG-anchored major pilin [Carnobacteriaceae bacterium zg-84]|uniref:SpaH/EbpB family LPXTG-anchored major pilin n=1 Tax=Granulicatella sp. zg-84 TaxID=2678503 RepID=UPI0013C18807|nr:SpaH/EbpB family LPXTG-anchored major pilin [Granulicatella sp. zg-84]NEW66294.1 SpaH/EbpB family LPXTG-anchored major pilin [Granulicatella sp. zg-84]QMI85619.1 SpaH/EbpB family LPXTG-anchored major pilin [Carnobacteriaceae bacterium zg-84]
MTRTSKLKRVNRVALAMMLLGGAFVPAVPYAQPVFAINGVSASVPDRTTVTIVKLQADAYNSTVPKVNENGQALTNTEIGALGTNVRTLSNVTFKWYKIPEDKLNDPEWTNEKLMAKTEAQLDALITGNDNSGLLDPTAENGEVRFIRTKEQNGTYWIIEHSAPSEVSAGYAVPFRLTVPLSASDGSGYLSEAHVYPKNVTGKLPSVDKDVNQLGSNEGSYNAGQDIQFYLKGTIPTNIDTYSKYDFTDTLDEALDYVGVGKVQFGTTELIKDTDYTVTPPTTDNRTVTVSLTSEGLDKITRSVSLDKRNHPSATEIGNVTENTDANPFIQVELKAKINDKAIMGKGIKNETKIVYKNSGGNHHDPNDPHKPNTPPSTPPGTPDTPPETPETPPSPPVYVYTGGKRFTKDDATNENVTLSGAEFKLYNTDQDETPMKWTDGLIAANKAAIDAGKFKLAVAGEDIVLVSDEHGEFEIKGLGYLPDTSTTAIGDGSKQYYLKETKAPTGYQLLTSKISFTVSQTSYYIDPTAIMSATENGNATADKVHNNKRPTIPDTGGIGTVIFIALGLGLMGFAFIGMKKSKK